MNTHKHRTVDYRIDPFDLHLFVAVMRQGTITAAASEVNISLAAASARLKTLEDATGSRLLDRSKLGAVPTDAGRALLRHANRVLAELESLHVEMASFGLGLRGTLRLLCNTSAMSEMLPRTIGSFLVATPDLDVDIQELPSESIIDSLHKGHADIGIVADHVDTSGLIAHPWIDDRLVAVLPKRWPTGRGRSITFSELLEYPFVGLSRDSGLSRFLAAQASRSGRVPRHRVRVGGFDAVAQLVSSGVGAAVMPESAVLRYCNADIKTLTLSDAWSRRKLLVCTTVFGSDLPSVRGLADALLNANTKQK